MREMLLSYLPTFEDFVKNLVLTLFSGFVLAVGGVVGLRLWKFVLAGAKAGKIRGYGEIRKRVRSDSYFVAHQTGEIILGFFMLTLLVIVLLIYTIPEMPDREMMIVVLAFLAVAMGAGFLFEATCNQKAAIMRTRSEKRRKIPRRKWQGKS